VLTFIFYGMGYKSEVVIVIVLFSDLSCIQGIRIKIHSFIYYKSTQETCMHGYDRAVENNIDFSKCVIVSKA